MEQKITITLSNDPLMGHSQDDRGIAEFFDRCAAKRMMDDFEPAEREMLRQFLDRWAIRPGMRVLEPGCGAGWLPATDRPRGRGCGLRSLA
jgi:hypothetical protein